MTSGKDTTSQLIAKAASHDKPAKENDYLSNLEESNLSANQRQLQINILQQQLDEDKDNHRLRTKYANKIYFLVFIWFICVIAGVSLSGFSSYTGFVLSDKVLIVFIATTTLNVLGLFAIVAKWMFQQNNNQSIVKK